jgi:ubiquitin-conjugating enzyme (huntingtin interacting protein 2)
MDARLRRINKEIAGTFILETEPTLVDLQTGLTDCKSDKTSNVQIELIDNSPYHLKGSFQGPEDTPYAGGQFDVVGLVRQ